MPNITEIPCDELKQHVSSSKSVSFISDGCKIHSKHGKVEFDFSDRCPTKIHVHVKRTSGNGKLLISGQEFTVGSRIYQTFDIDISEKIELSRPKDSTGVVVLLGFTFSADIVGESAVQVNWKSLIGRCGKYSCLRMVKGRLFASTGGYIEKGNIVKLIETNPPNVASRNGDKIYFNGSCEITNIVLSPGEAASRPAELHVDRKPPTPINTPRSDDRVSAIKRAGGNEIRRPQKYKHQLPSLDEHVLYDSLSLRNFNQFIAKDKAVKQVRSNNQAYLVVRQKGKVKASMSTLEANTDYICIINGKKLNGNGRLYIAASIDDNFTGQACEAIFGSNFTNRYIQIRTSNGAPNITQKLHLSMPEKFCHGEVLIQRIMIIEDLGIDYARAGLEGRRYLPASDVPHPGSPKALSSLDMDVCHGDDTVYAVVKKYAFYPHIQDARYINTSIRGTVVSNNVSGVVWASRVKSMIKHIRIGDMKSEVNNDALLISHLGGLKPAKRIWIEPFEFGAKISESDIRAINSAQTVLSPSLSNVQSLRDKFKNKKIEQAHRPLPWVQPEPEKVFKDLDFVLIFERDRKGMNQLLKVWSSDLPKLVVMGARGRYHDFVFPLNEYYPYHRLVYLMKRARFIIDLPENCDYHSSILDLANAMGKTMLSTNRYVLDKPNGILIVQNDECSSPSDEVLKQGIDKAKAKASGDIKDMSNYNEKFIDQVGLLFSL